MLSFSKSTESAEFNIPIYLKHNLTDFLALWLFRGFYIWISSARLSFILINMERLND